MSAIVTVKFIGDTTGLNAAISQLNAALSRVGGANQGITGTGSNSLFGTMMGAGVAANLATQAINTMGNAFSSAINKGMGMNVTLRDAPVTLAKMEQTLAGMNEIDAMASARVGMEKLIEIEPKTAGSMQDLIDGLTATRAAGAGLGLTMSQQAEIVGGFANVMGNIGIPLWQIKQELGSIMGGTIDMNSRIAKILEIDNATVAKWKESGTFFEEMKKRMGALGAESDSVITIMSSLDSAVQMVFAEMTKPLFDLALEGAKALTVSFKEMLPLVKGAKDAIAEMFGGETTALGQNFAISLQQGMLKMGDYLLNLLLGVGESFIALMMNIPTLLGSAMSMFFGAQGMLSAGASYFAAGLLDAVTTPMDYLIASLDFAGRLLQSALVQAGMLLLDTIQPAADMLGLGDAISTARSGLSGMMKESTFEDSLANVRSMGGTQGILGLNADQMREEASAAFTASQNEAADGMANWADTASKTIDPLMNRLTGVTADSFVADQVAALEAQKVAQPLAEKTIEPTPAPKEKKGVGAMVEAPTASELAQIGGGGLFSMIGAGITPQQTAQERTATAMETTTARVEEQTSLQGEMLRVMTDSRDLLGRILDKIGGGTGSGLTLASA